jgi:hypothetical protein
MADVTQMKVFWDITPYKIISLFQHFRGGTASIFTVTELVQVGTED